MSLVATTVGRVQIPVQTIFFHNLNYKFEKENLSEVHQLIDFISIELSTQQDDFISFQHNNK